MPSQKRKRLLVVMHYPVYGGPHNRVIQVSNALRESGWETVCILPKDEGDAFERLQEKGLEVHQIALGRARRSRSLRTQFGYVAGFIGDIFRLRRFVLNNNIDVVMLAGLMNPQAALAVKLTGRRLIWQIVDSATPRIIIKLMMPLLKHVAHVVMFNGEALRKAHDCEQLKTPFVVYYPPVDTLTRFVPNPGKRSQLRQQLAIPDDAYVVGMVANLNPQKGIEYFLRAAGMLYKSDSRYYFLVCGTRYPYKEEYNKLIDAERIKSEIPESHLIFIEGRRDLENVYPAFDVKVISSVPNSEGTTTTAIEAMACGVPVVATDVGAVREIVCDPEVGRLVAPLKPELIAAAVADVLSDKVQHSLMSGRAIQRSREKFDVTVSIARHLDALDAAMAHS